VKYVKRLLQECLEFNTKPVKTGSFLANRVWFLLKKTILTTDMGGRGKNET